MTMRTNILTYSYWWDTLCSVNNWYCKLDSSDNDSIYINIFAIFVIPITIIGHRNNRVFFQVHSLNLRVFIELFKDCLY